MKALIIGCGPGGENWRDVYDAESPDIVIACNSAIVDTADIADYFVCVENLGPDPAKDHPWILTDPGHDLVRICNSKTLRRLKEQYGGYWDNWIPYDRPETPMIYPDSSVGTVLYYVLDMLQQGLGTVPHLGNWDGPGDIPPYRQDIITEIHLIGFPLAFDGDTQHWTEPDATPYAVHKSHYMPPNVFVRVNGLRTIWQFAMAAAFVSMQPWPFTLVNHGGGLLDIPTIGDLWQFATDEPDKKEYEV